MKRKNELRGDTRTALKPIWTTLLWQTASSCVCMPAWEFTNTYNVNYPLMSWSEAGNEFQEKRCLFCAGAHIPYTFGPEEIAPYLHPVYARARSCRQ